MIFEYSDYRLYIEKFISQLPLKGHGFRTKMAEHLDCKTSFISQVLNGNQNLSSEQAFALNSLFNHGESEGKYFLTLVQISRAGNKALKDHYKKEAEQIRNESLRLKNRVQADVIRNKEDEFKYFSSADYAYVHILTTIPQYQSKEALLRKLNTSPSYLEKILDYLLRLGYVVYEKGKYLPGPSILHVPDDAAIISTHHTNWRIQAIKACQSPQDLDFHYSSMISISEEDFLKIKAMIIKSIENYREIINASASDKPYSFCLDFYEMK